MELEQLITDTVGNNVVSGVRSVRSANLDDELVLWIEIVLRDGKDVAPETMSALTEKIWNEVLASGGTEFPVISYVSASDQTEIAAA